MVDSVIEISAPFELFHDIDGMPLEDGYIYIGQSGLDPISNPITVYSDVALTLTINQPIRTMGGYAVLSGTPTNLYIPLNNYSITVLNKRGTLIYTNLAVEYTNVLSTVVFTSLQDAANTDLSGLNLIQTKSFYDYTAPNPPKGGAFYYPDNTSGTASTLYTDNSGFYDSNGNGFSLSLDQHLTAWMFGVSGDGTDDATELQYAFTFSSDNNVNVEIPDDLDTYVQSQLIAYDNMHITINGKITRDWLATTAGGNDKKEKATIRNEHCPDNSDYIIDPGPYVPVSRNTNVRFDGMGEIRVSAAIAGSVDGTTMFAGPHLTLYACDSSYIGPITLRGRCGEWATALWGNDWTIDRLRIRDQTEVFDDGLHFLSAGGVNRVISPDIESGDDSLAFGSNYNLPLSNITVSNPVVYSHRAFAFGTFQNREGSTAAFATPDQPIEKITVTGLNGYAGINRNALLKLITDVGNEGIIRDIQITDFDLTQGDIGGHDLVNDEAFLFVGGDRLKIHGHIHNPIRHMSFIGTTNLDLNVVSEPCQGAADVNLYLENVTGVVDGVYVSSDRYVCQVVDSDITVKGKLTEIPSNYSGIIIQGNSVVHINNRSEKRNAATLTYAFRNESATAEVYIGGDQSDYTNVDRIMNVVANLLRYRTGLARGLNKTFTIASGSVSIYGANEIYLLGEGGVSDTLTSITTGQTGQRITVRNGEVDPVTVTITLSTGVNLVLGSNYTLNTANKAMILEYDGANWQEITRY